ncbi:MAG: hypothetical protein PHN57_05535, partial [Candidatus Omnitrophica bacterium]|nr:hypothetical protein [Candidatus Omnitrophota bacterium]
KRLCSRPGLALTVEVNGELRIIKGTLGTPAKILLNKREVFSLTDKIGNNDVLEFQEAVDGNNGSATISEILETLPVKVTFNGETLEVDPPVLMNGRQAALDEQVPDLAKIETSPLRVRDVLRFKGINLENLSERQILVNINSAPKILTQRNFTLHLNAALCDLDAPVNPLDQVQFTPDAPTFYRIKDIIEIPEGSEKLRVNVDGKDLELALDSVQVFMNGQAVKPEEFLIDGADIKVFLVKEKKVLLSEIFKYIEFDPYKGIGKNIKITVNERPAGFTTPLENGARVRIDFEDRV